MYVKNNLKNTKQNVVQTTFTNPDFGGKLYEI